LLNFLDELSAYPAPPGVLSGARADDDGEYSGVILPFQLRTERGILSFFSTTTIFGTPVDITLSELALEAFFPADAATWEALRGQ
jgi:hypothetical protein